MGRASGTCPLIEIYVTHYVTEAIAGYNDLAIDCAHGILETTDRDDVPYQLIFVYYAETQRLADDLIARMPPQVKIVREYCGLQQHLMNRATALARVREAEYFVCLHNDVRPCPGWLRNVVTDLRNAEVIYGRGNVVCSPRHPPYHWLAPHPGARAPWEVWSLLQPEAEPKILTCAQMLGYCMSNGFRFDGRHVLSPNETFTVDHGHQLMMYAAAPEFFDDIGGCDESFVGVNFGDCDWGMRVLLTNKKNLISQGCLIQHIAGITFNNQGVREHFDNNDQRFIQKWGMETFLQLQDGSVWIKLHQEQRDRRERLGLVP